MKVLVWTEDSSKAERVLHDVVASKHKIIPDKIYLGVFFDGPNNAYLYDVNKEELKTMKKDMRWCRKTQYLILSDGIDVIHDRSQEAFESLVIKGCRC